jgi:hypothetical protein
LQQHWLLLRPPLLLQQRHLWIFSLAVPYVFAYV